MDVRSRWWGWLAGALLVLTACGSGETAAPPDRSDAVVASGSPTVAAVPVGRILVARFTAELPELVTTAADGSDERPFASEAAFEVRQVSPDGSVIAVVAASDAGPLVGGTIGVDGSNLELFEPAGPTLNLACGVWAPGGRLACEGWDDRKGQHGLYTVARDGSDAVRLTRERDVPCDYSPDGAWLAFVRTDHLGEVGSLMVMDAGGGVARTLSGSVTMSGLPCDWSPDGRSILVGTVAGSLRTVALDGTSEPIEGEGLDGSAGGPSWNADGSRILFTMSLEPGEPDVYTVAADGSDLVQVTSGDTWDEGWRWLP